MQYKRSTMHHLHFLFFLFAISSSYANDPLAGRSQLLVVTSLSWEATQGTLQLYERPSAQAPWMAIGEPKRVVLGRAGLAWGLGLHPQMQRTDPFKIEGDGKSPAGIFSLGSAFGFAFKMDHLRVEYLPLTEQTEAIDDPLSLYYNQVVNQTEVLSDWQSSEKMKNEPLYELGMIIHHNFPNPKMGAGSAIFFHIWQQEDSNTAGCTAMSRENLSLVLSWLEKEKNPALVQLPLFVYHELQETWNLPDETSARRHHTAH